MPKKLKPIKICFEIEFNRIEKSFIADAKLVVHQTDGTIRHIANAYQGPKNASIDASKANFDKLGTSFLTSSVLELIVLKRDRRTGALKL